MFFLHLQAYRIEPLILKHYSTIRPLKIHKADSNKQIPYHEIQPMAYSAATKKEEEMTTSKLAEEPSTSSSGQYQNLLLRFDSLVLLGSGVVFTDQVVMPSQETWQ